MRQSKRPITKADFIDTLADASWGGLVAVTANNADGLTIETAHGTAAEALATLTKRYQLDLRMAIAGRTYSFMLTGFAR